MHFKDFDKWNIVKKEINDTNRKINIRAGDIRWVSLGINIGSEMDGKGESFNRPALIIGVFGSRLALVVPLTSKVKNTPGYMTIKWHNQINMLCIHQVRILSQKIIFSRLAHIPGDRLKLYKEAIKKFFDL